MIAHKKKTQNEAKLKKKDSYFQRKKLKKKTT